MTDTAQPQALSPAAVVDAMHEAFRHGDLDAIAMHWHDDVVYEAPGVSMTGKPARIMAEQVWLGAFSENDVRTHARLVDGEAIIDFCTMSGVHTGPLMLPDGTAIPPSGARISGTYAARYRIVAGKVVEQEVIYDRLALLQNIGVMPA
ncbi:ester cyclase [Erythrobacter sp. NE805]|uniref:ester cyclase n=1 Tax=Erythrobacter sp. NE805 TaxID=3389875 RepID=UPI00396AFF73